jgi:deoxyribose-phosphate aldolase
MDIDRDDREHDREQRARLEWMIKEFEEARRRRLVKTSTGTVKSGATPGTKDPPKKPVTSHS